MPEKLEYAPFWLEPARSPRRRTVVVAFIAPQVWIVGGWLLTRVAIRYSYWDAIPLFLVALVIGAVTNLILAAGFAGGQSKREVTLRFILWILASAMCVFVGMGLVELLPIPAGDGP